MEGGRRWCIFGKGSEQSRSQRSLHGGAGLAKNVVASGLAERCEVPVRLRDWPPPEPVSVSVDTFCTGKLDEGIGAGDLGSFNFSRRVIQAAQSAAADLSQHNHYGHFGPRRRSGRAHLGRYRTKRSAKREVGLFVVKGKNRPNRNAAGPRERT